MRRNVQFSDLHLAFEDIREHYDDVRRALLLYFAAKPDDRFLDYSQDQLDAERSTRLKESETLSSLNLLASIEAAFRIDFNLRCELRKKDDLSRAFRAIYKQHSHRAKYKEDILDAWREHYPKLRPLANKLNETLNYRHWLAHGRYWNPNRFRITDFDELYYLAKEIDAAFPFLAKPNGLGHAGPVQYP